jgi:EAL domain-containing protein (putative c-di-GMP-specific phosphodiesterase class I)
VSASIGVTFYPQDDSDADQLIRHADRAMYEAKQSGKNRFYVFDSAKDAEFRSQGEQILRMRLAIANGELELYYQPKVNLKTAEVVGLEALIRWQHPELGLLSPAAFLPHIERDAVIEEVGSWVLREAMEQMTIWLQAGVRMAVSINVAARQILHPDFSREIAGLLAAFPAIAASDLELEILETSALEDISAVSAMMQACHQLGVRFAVDDFGTGYSSLTYLKKLPAETLKIDQSFVRDMLVDHEDLAIVKGVIGLCEAFHRTAVAEGVESLAHGERLLELGCECAQGYGIARPMPAQQVLAWISTWNQRAPGPVGGWSV